MSPIPYPFPHSCYIRFSNGHTRMALINCEQATSPEEISQSLNHRSPLHFRKPLVLHFNNPTQQTATCFRFQFDVEVIVVNKNNIVEKVYPVRKSTPDQALHIHFFGGYQCAILVPAGFSKQWKVEPGVTAVKRISMQTLAEKTA